MKELSDSMCSNMVRILFRFIPNQGSSKIKKAHELLLAILRGKGDSRTVFWFQAV